MRHIVVILHGIECRPEEILWNEELAWRLAASIDANTPGITQVEFYPRKYGYVSGTRSWFNWGDLATGRSYRDAIVDHEETYFRKLQALRGTDAKISIICHSLGGYIVHKLLERGFKFHRIIELYGAGNENQDWAAIEDNFDRIYVWYSPNDEVLPRSNFGQIGLVGPQNLHSRVFPVITADGHTSWMEDAVMQSRLPIWREQLEG